MITKILYNFFHPELHCGEEHKYRYKEYIILRSKIWKEIERIMFPICNFLAKLIK